MYTPTPLAYEIAEKYHPAWKQLKPYAKHLMARNTHQVLGQDCNTPVDAVICWTKDGSTGITTAKTGGTGQAIRIAYDLNIPIYNLKKAKTKDILESILDDNNRTDPIFPFM